MSTTRLSPRQIRDLVLSRIDAACDAGRLTEVQRLNAHRVRWPVQNLRILGTSSKVEKSRKRGFLTAVVYLAPERESVAYAGQNVCPLASYGCSRACLGTRSRLAMPAGRHAKLWKTLLWLWAPEVFRAQLAREIYRLRNRALHVGLTPAVRLNGTSDILWERKAPELFSTFPDVVFYDYTKIPERFNRGSLPPNYHLTFSRSEDNEETSIRLLSQGHNVAIVFTSLRRAMRNGWRGFSVTNGDLTDARPIDRRGVVVGLSPKGHAKDHDGFFVHN